MRSKTRKSKQKGGEDYSGKDLTGEDFSGQDLARSNFSNSTLSQTKFMNAILTGTNFTGANLIEANLSNANLSNANLFSADLTDAYLELANLTDANLTGANLTNTNLTNANLTGANLNNTILRGAIFKYAKMDRVILNDREKIKKISNKTNFSRTRLEKKNILNAKSKSKKNLAHIVSFFRKTKIYKPLIEKIYDGIKKKSIQIDNNKRKKIENILSNTVINSIVNNNNEDFINISNDKKLLKKNTYTPEEINKIITAFYKNKIYKKKLEVLLSRTNLSNEEKLLIEAITNKTNIIPTLKTDKSKYNSVYYDPIIGQYIFIIPAGTLFFRGSKTEEEETKIPDILYTYSVPTMCFGVKGFNFRYNIIYVVKAIKDLKFIISILPSPKSRHNLRKDKLIFSNNERSKNLSELQGNMLYSEKNDPSLHKDIRKYSNIDGIISIAGMDSFYEGYSKELRSMSDWLKRSVQLGVPTEYYISHMNIDSSSNIGYPEYVIYSDNSDSKNNANTKIEYIMTISSDKPKASNESIIELCQKLFEYLSNTRVGELYWDKRTGNFFDFKGYNKNEKYFTKYDTDLTLKHVLLEIDGDITTILNNSKPLEGTLTKIQYITKDLCDKIHEIITTPTNISVLSKININNKKFKFQNRENRENFSGGHGQELMTLSINEAYAKYLIPIPYSLFVEQNIEDFS